MKREAGKQLPTPQPPVGSPTRDIFAAAAARYDILNRIISLGRDRALRRIAIRAAEFRAGSRILDLGAGTGDMADAVLRAVPQSRVYAVDDCSAAVSLGRVKPALSTVGWTIGDGARLPFRSGAFDGAVAAFSLRNIADLPSALSELYRVIAGGGKLVILELVYPEGRLGRLIFQFHFEHIVPAAGGLFGSDSAAYEYLPRSIKSFYSARLLREALRTRGFKEIFFAERMFGTAVMLILTKCPS